MTRSRIVYATPCSPYWSLVWLRLRSWAWYYNHWEYIYAHLSCCVQKTMPPWSHPPPLLDSCTLSTLSAMIPEPLKGREFGIYVLFRTENSVISFSWNLSQLWTTLLTTTHYNRFFFIDMKSSYCLVLRPELEMFIAVPSSTQAL